MCKCTYHVCMATLEKRVQVLFSTEQYARVEAAAAAEHMSVGAFIREAVEARWKRQSDDRAAAWDRIFAKADALPDYGPIDWEEEKAAFDRDILREPDEERRAS